MKRYLSVTTLFLSLALTLPSCIGQREDGSISLSIAGLDTESVTVLTVILKNGASSANLATTLDGTFSGQLLLNGVKAGITTIDIFGNDSEGSSVQKGSCRNVSVGAGETVEETIYMADIIYESCVSGAHRCAWIDGGPAFVAGCVEGDRLEMFEVCEQDEICTDGQCLSTADGFEIDATDDETTDQDTLTNQIIDECGTPVVITCAEGGQCLPVLPTGLTACLGVESSEIECPGTAGTESCADLSGCGQDAQYQSDERIFSDGFSNGQSWVCDPETTLVWQNGIVSNKTWAEAVAHCDGLDWGGRDDWRLPTIAELRSLSDYGRIGASFYSEHFTALPTALPTEEQPYLEKFWSVDKLSIDEERAWYWSANSGSMAFMAHNEELNVICVRMGPEKKYVTSPYLTDTPVSGQTVVTDQGTRLVWKGIPASARHWDDALAYCEKLDYAGYSDWRLPDINELMSLSNIKKYNPGTTFPSAPSNWFWSSTLYLKNTQYARIVNIKDHGEMSSVYATSGGYAHVYCVRGPGKLECSDRACLDRNSNLMWQKHPLVDISNADAKSACEKLDVDGYSGWRIPTIDELRSIIDGCSATNISGVCNVRETCALDGCRGKECSGCDADEGPSTDGCYRDDGLDGPCDWYWSSTGYDNSPNANWFVDFSNGLIGQISRSQRLSTYCVREHDPSEQIAETVESIDATP